MNYTARQSMVLKAAEDAAGQRANTEAEFDIRDMIVGTILELIMDLKMACTVLDVMEMTGDNVLDTVRKTLEDGVIKLS